MKIKMLNGTEYSIMDVCNKGNTLEIMLSTDTLTAEEAEAAFSSRENIKRIEVYGTTKLTSTLLDYTVLSEVKLKSGVVTVVLVKEVDATEQRITEAHSAAVEAQATAAGALTATQEIKEENEQIIANMDYLAMEIGVEV